MRIFKNNKTGAFLCGAFGFLLCLCAFFDILGCERRDSILGFILVALSIILFDLMDLRKEIK